MGGSIAVTIREENGTEHRMCRWTNSMPWGLNNVKMLSIPPDPTHLAAYLKVWNEMRADYEANKSTGKFEFPMTDVYAPYPFLAPEGYGLVIMDFQRKTILSKNNYTTLGQGVAITSAFDWDMFGRHPEEGTREESLRAALARPIDNSEEDDGESNLQRLAAWWNAKRIVKAGELIPRSNGDVTPDPKLMNATTFEEFALGLGEYTGFVFDLTPFTFIEARDLPWAEVLEKVKALGFALSEEEMALWNDAIKQETED